MINGMIPMAYSVKSIKMENLNSELCFLYPAAGIDITQKTGWREEFNMLLNTEIKGIRLIFETSDKVFSPGGIDRGTLAMLSLVEFKDDDRVLDLGCGYGAVGILAAKILGANKVVMLDNNPEAIYLARRNAELNGAGGAAIVLSDGFKSLDTKGFTVILSNPPYHADFSVAKEFMEKGFNRLEMGGCMYMVTKRKDWYKNRLTAIFGGTRIWEIDGYYVFMSVKKNTNYANKHR